MLLLLFGRYDRTLFAARLDHVYMEFCPARQKACPGVLRWTHTLPPRWRGGQSYMRVLWVRTSCASHFHMPRRAYTPAIALCWYLSRVPSGSQSSLLFGLGSDCALNISMNISKWCRADVEFMFDMRCRGVL